MGTPANRCCVKSYASAHCARAAVLASADKQTLPPPVRPQLTGLCPDVDASFVVHLHHQSVAFLSDFIRPQVESGLNPRALAAVPCAS
jgi:hypothetical protein